MYDLIGSLGFPTDLGLIGRLDLETTGIMIMTDDNKFGSAVRDPVLNYPISPFKVKEYDVVLLGLKLNPAIYDDEELIRLMTEPFTFSRFGITHQTSIPNVTIRKRWRDEALSSGQLHLGWCALVSIELTEGKHHQIRRIANRIGVHIVTLHRRRIAQILSTDDLPLGSARWLTQPEVETIRCGLNIS